MKIFFPHIDQFSFWVGFIFSSLLFFILRFSRSALDLILQKIKENKKALEAKAANSVEANYLKDLYQRVQELHLASSLFPLEEVLVEPRLLAPPPRFSPDEPDYSEDFVSGLVPYLPDWPEVAAAFNTPTLSIIDALSGNSDIVIVGQPGSGKSVALAYVASILSKRSSAISLPVNLIPFLVDLADLNFPLKKSKDSMDLIVENLSSYPSYYDQTLTTKFTKKAFLDGNALLLIDGTDELTTDSLNLTIDFIKSLKQNYPNIKIITTGIPENLKGLVTLNFIPFSLACWVPSDQKLFLSNWGRLWSQRLDYLTEENSKNNQIDYVLLNNWIYSLCSNFSPFELTMLTWGSYAGDLKSGKIIDSIYSHIQRLKPTDCPLDALEMLALQSILSTKTSFEAGEAKQWIQDFVPVEIIPETTATGSNNILNTKITNPKKDINSITTVPSKNIILNLVDTGILSAHKNNKVRFSHQIFVGVLAGNILDNTDPDTVLELPNWSGKYLAMNYYAAMHDGTKFATKLIASSNYPLQRTIFFVARWLRIASINSPWRTILIEKLVEIIKFPGQPLGLRGQVLAALVLSNDEGIRLLLRQLLESDDSDLLQLCILGLAILKDIKSIELISNLMNHKNPKVVHAACLGLVTIGTPSALDQVAGLLLHADKEFRKAAAEALANNPFEGHAMLREGASLDDFLIRWAVVYGLRRINTTWATDLLAKLRIEDDQWIVRNAANEVIERKSHQVQPIPKRLPPPSECPWLIAFAAQKGLGVSPNTPATDILLMALTEGTELEKLASLDYLRISSSPKIFPIFYKLMQSNDYILKEAIFRTIWEMAARGVIIPEPSIFEAS